MISGTVPVIISQARSAIGGASRAPPLSIPLCSHYLSFDFRSFMIIPILSPRSDKGCERVANLANYIYHRIHFYVNNTKTADEKYPREKNIVPLTLFKGGVTVVNGFLCIFVPEIKLIGTNRIVK